MKQKLKSLINQTLQPAGFELIRRSPTRIEMDSALHRILSHGFPIATVIDIGAARGKWSLMAMNALKTPNFLAVEPLREREEDLRKVAHAHSRFDYALCVAGEMDGETARLNVAADLDGSTVDGRGGEPRDVPVRSIDGLVKEKKLPGPYLVKFDTHGYELPILRGAAQTLRETEVIIMEVYNFQFVPQALRFHQMCAHMEDRGFRCYDIASPTLRARDHAFWQMDLFFARIENPIFKESQYM